ncbi:integral membrane protein [Xylona heveae TC161]|uniref:Integral membrane protein n=1 Tax=Xylona heveae (strain CBS 132557 / TC161) TaxID=1328760 RepID=A0A165FZA3_XYLHT|nr:integral membrane protein [Xylona heveae TC161]KZF21560.1 integral membrane protein [Xylona heveae TC161]
MIHHNLTTIVDRPHWDAPPAWKLPEWVEPIIVASILVTSMIVTRRRDFKIFGGQSGGFRKSILDDPDAADSADDLLRYDRENEDDAQEPLAASKHLPKRRYCCGFLIYTPNSSRFANHIHSRILQKFPFLMEMFYWIITYAFYRLTIITSQAIFSKTGIWDVAQEHALEVLEFEQYGPLSFLFPITEVQVQQWFMHGHQTFLTVLNWSYALIHIPGTVGFIAWYYYLAPSHPTFATARRTITLINHLAFITFTFYPCMPPRLLPEKYGFIDSARHDDARSVWMSGKYVNSLAAMPSMHFGYAFCIGVTLIYHSGIFRRTLEKGEVRKPLIWKLVYVAIGLAYPTLILSAIVATANHYWLDALMAVLVTGVAFLCNRVYLIFLPLEDLLLWVLRIEKPIPSTGERFRQRGGRL